MQKNVNGQIQHEYHLKDHLGSTDVITDQNGNEISSMAFDPFGKRLTEHVGSSALSQDAANDSSYHDYTGHSQLDHLGLVHMGGRVYDPDSGRFLSADLFVQSPYNTQSYNRYSYVFNNPLRNTDPSGYLTESDIMSGLANNNHFMLNITHRSMRGRHHSAMSIQRSGSDGMFTGFANYDLQNARGLINAFKIRRIERRLNNLISGDSGVSASGLGIGTAGELTAKVIMPLTAQKGEFNTSSPAGDGFSNDFNGAVKELVDRGIIPAEVANNSKLLVNMTTHAGLRPSDATHDASVKVVKDLSLAADMVASGDWKYVDGSHSGGVMTIYRHGALPGYTTHLDRLGGATYLTGRQNLIETIHHEYLHYSGTTSHRIDALGWGAITRSQLGGWLLK